MVFGDMRGLAHSCTGARDTQDSPDLALDAPVVLIGRDTCNVYPDADALFSRWGVDWVRENVGLDYVCFSHTERLTLTEGHLCLRRVYLLRRYILRGSFGEVIHPEAYIAAWMRRQHTRRMQARYGWALRRGMAYPRIWGLYRLRYWSGKGPVPGTGKCRRRYRYFRSPRTFAERKASQVIDRQEPQARASRNARNLPSNWDDIGRKDIDNRNWKRHRRHQYKRACVSGLPAQPRVL